MFEHQIERHAVVPRIGAQGAAQVQLAAQHYALPVRMAGGQAFGHAHHGHLHAGHVGRAHAANGAVDRHFSQKRIGGRFAKQLKPLFDPGTGTGLQGIPGFSQIGQLTWGTGIRLDGQLLNFILQRLCTHGFHQAPGEVGHLR